MQSLFLSMDYIAAIVRVEITRIAEHFKEPTDSLFSLLLRFLLHVNIFVCFVKVGEDSIDKLQKFEGSLVVEFDHAKVAHEWRTVQLVHYLFDLARAQVRRLCQKLLASMTTALIYSIWKRLNRSIADLLKPWNCYMAR